MGKKWTPDEKSWLKENYSRYKNKEIADRLNKSTNSIVYRARVLGLSKKNLEKEDYFEKPHVRNSYWAGFLAADGSIRDVKTNMELSCQLKLSDKYHLLQLKKDLGIYSDVGEGTYGGYSRCFISVNSRKLCQDLNNNYNITPNKSFTYKPPKDLPNRAMTAFILGIIDGDGHIAYKEDPPHHPEIQIVGTKYLLKEIQEYLNIMFSIESVIIKKDQHRKTTRLIRITGESARHLYKVLYLLPVPKLKRKWKKKLFDWAVDYVPWWHLGSKDIFYDVYLKVVKDKKSQSEVAREYGVYQSTIRKMLHSEDMKKIVEKRENTTYIPPKLIKDWTSQDYISIYTLYVEKGLSYKEVSKHFNTSAQNITRIIKSENFKNGLNTKQIKNLGEKLDKNKKKYSTKRCRIIKTGEVFNSIRELSENVTHHYRTIASHCNNRVKNPKYEFVED